MAAFGAIAAIASTALSFVGTIAQANAQRQQAAQLEANAQAERVAADYKAKEEERQAQEQRASFQRRAHAKRREAEYTQSRLTALAAASGGGADDPSIIKLASDIAGQGEYDALSEMFSGESRGRALETQAALDRYSGNVRANSLMADAATMRRRSNMTILGGVGGLFANAARYG